MSAFGGLGIQRRCLGGGRRLDGKGARRPEGGKRVGVGKSVSEEERERSSTDPWGYVWGESGGVWEGQCSSLVECM
jgi:hypothetical protein